jgi:hypothetical protein
MKRTSGTPVQDRSPSQDLLSLLHAPHPSGDGSIRGTDFHKRHLSDREQVVEQMDRRRIIEKPPPRETRACQSGKVVRGNCKSGGVACGDRGFSIRMNGRTKAVTQA